MAAELPNISGETRESAALKQESSDGTQKGGEAKAVAVASPPRTSGYRGAL
ncbi:hypothetical protein [Pseudarthrobacter sp. PS3-L1]|uniref:hypothetical protein n=1 Tax=Pseudarthrobacter sp. PS3-L1 TaxID=3046207 RepID=UPI0024B88D33|nr:hypothetical protein [Pseudarthrobacter sp. PS3-L1]MDJ0319281.1 hypothetical protein [Pseudarthrobacter sp. PS3-L1]